MKEESNNDLVVLLQSILRGKIYIHRNNHMEFPDPDHIVIQGEDLTHHILCEVNEVEAIPHRLLMIRKEMYQMLGDYNDLNEVQKIQVQVVRISYEEYFKKLDILEGRIQKRQQQMNMQVEDSMSEEMWRVIQEDQDNQDRQKLQQELELKAQQLLQQQRLEQSEVQTIQQVSVQETTSTRKIKLRQPAVQEDNQQCEYNPNDISVQESQISSDNLQYILYSDASNDDDKVYQTMKVVISGNKRRYLHLEYYLTYGYKWKYEKRRSSSTQLIQQDLKKTRICAIRYIETPFIWNYAGRWVNFTNYMMSKTHRTQSWHYITDHYIAIWKARLYIMKPEQQLTDMEKFCKVANWGVFQQRYDVQIEKQLCDLVQNRGQLFEIMTEYKLGQKIYSIKKPDDSELLMEDNAFYENSSFSIVYIRLKNKQRQLKFLYRKIQYVEGDIKGKYFVVYKDVHSSINFLISSAIMIPGGTPRNAYKWGSFNINQVKGTLSSSMESLIDSDNHLLLQKINYLDSWIQSQKELMGN